MPTPTETDAVPASWLAAESMRLVGVNARQAEAVGVEAIALARQAGDVAAESTAWRARGLAAREGERLADAEAFLRKAVAVGRRASPQTEAEARTSLAFVLLERGKAGAARRTAERAVVDLQGREQARARVQLALVQQRTGAAGDALHTYGLVLRQVRRFDDPLWEARLHNNRGILHAYEGHPGAAERDLQRAAELYEELGQKVLAGEARWNLGFAAALRGDIVTALQRYEAAGAELELAGSFRSVSLPDLCQVLLAAGLVDDAREAIDRGIGQLTDAGMDSDVAEARLLLCEALIAAGDLDEARQAALEARRAFQDQGRPRHALLARYATMQCTPVHADHSSWQGAESLAEALDRGGWSVAATDIRLLIARRRLATQGFLPPEAIAQVRNASRTGPVGQRMRAWYVVALARHAQGDPSGAAVALLAGLRVHERFRATLSATELQIRTAARAGELAEMGLQLALESGRADRVLAWAERWRAGSLLMRPVSPPKDPELAAQLTVLRGVTMELEQARLGGGDLRGLERRQRALERDITQRARSRRAALRQLPVAQAAGLHARLADHAMVEFVQSGRQLLAVVLAGGRTSLHHLGEVERVRHELESLRFAHGRMARGSSPRVQAATKASLESSASTLDALLLQPLLRRLGDRPLVIVPTGEMHVLPWALLSRAGQVPLTIVPSASAWAATIDRPSKSEVGVLVAAGPGLTAAEQEIAAVAEVYGSAVSSLPPAQASVVAFSAALAGRTTVHLAAHGRFRSDNPLLSSLELADGQITVFDLEALPSVPPLVVLSACDAGLSAVHPGDELMGLTGALLRMGTRTLVASVAPVPDHVARDTMVAFHRALAGGLRPAEALLQARSCLDAELVPAAASFVCLGAG